MTSEEKKKAFLYGAVAALVIIILLLLLRRGQTTVIQQSRSLPGIDLADLAINLGDINMPGMSIFIPDGSCVSEYGCACSSPRHEPEVEAKKSAPLFSSSVPVVPPLTMGRPRPQIRDVGTRSQYNDIIRYMDGSTTPINRRPR